MFRRIRSILIGVALSLSLVGCGTPILKKAQVVSQAAFLAANYEAMEASIAALPLNEIERMSVDEGVAGLNQVRTDLSALLDGNVQSDRVLDYATGDDILDRIRTNFNQVRATVSQYFIRTQTVPPQGYIQFNSVAVQLYSTARSVIESNQQIEGKGIAILLRHALQTYAAINTGGLITLPAPQGSFEL